MEHEHRWVLLGEMVLHYNKADLRNLKPEDMPGINRLEYCVGCGSTRLYLGGTTWAVLESECTKEFLKKFTTTTSVVVKKPPPEFTFKRKPTTNKRLGKGLTQLLSESSVRNSVKGLLPPKKPEE